VFGLFGSMLHVLVEKELLLTTVKYNLRGIVDSAKAVVFDVLFAVEL
jgi:hypothetical protein